MSELGSSETNTFPIPRPTTAEMLAKYGGRDPVVDAARIAGFEDPLQPDTAEERERHSKEAAQTLLDFRVRWDLETERLAAQHADRTPQPLAEVIPITRVTPHELGRFAGQAITRHAS